MRRKSILLAIIIIIQFLTGCRDADEITNIAIVTGIGFDRADDGDIVLSLLFPVTRSSGFGSSLNPGSTKAEETIMVSEKGRGVMDAYRKIEKKISRKIFFSQNQAIFIGERLAQGGISEVADFLYRNPESHLRAYIFFTKEKATDILSSHSIFERSIIEKFVKQEQLEVGFKTNLKDFLNMMTEEGIEPVAAQVTLVNTAVDSKSSLRTTGIEGAAVFHKYKLVGWLDSEEARGALWLRNEIKRGVITANISDDNSGGNVGMEIINAKTQVTPLLKDNHVEMEVKIYAEGKIYENSSKLDLSKSDEIRAVEEKVSEGIKKRIQLSLKKTQGELKSDVFGFGTTVFRKYPKLWNNYYKERWDEEFPMVKVKIVCDVNVSEVGITNKALTPENEKP